MSVWGEENEKARNGARDVHNERGDDKKGQEVNPGVVSVIRGRWCVVDVSGTI